MSEVGKRERTIVYLIAAVQFVNILDFMIVMPLGPDFAKALGVSTAHIGYLGGAYTLSAAFAGMLGAGFLDRFDRRRALAYCMLGLGVGTIAGGFAQGFWSLIAARVVAGAFGGPATAIALAIVSDVVPKERRGKAMGIVMTAFSVASILGVPAGLELARLFGWRAPFIAVSGLSLAISSMVIYALPSLRAHLDCAKTERTTAQLFDSLALTSLLGTSLTMFGVFAVVPNISAFLQNNLGYPRDRLGVLYLVGGLLTFLATRRIGVLVDRFGATKILVAGTGLFATALFLAFIRPVSVGFVVFVFPLLMLAGSARGVPMNSLSSRVPHPEQRARFMSAQSSVQHLSSALGALLSSTILTADSQGRLQGMPAIAIGSISIAVLVPFLAHRVEMRVKRREQVA